MKAAHGYERDMRFIPAHHQPSLLLDQALTLGIGSHQILRGTGLFYDDILSGNTRISAEQFLTLMANVQRQISSLDTSFLFGQRLWPGHYGATSQLLQHSASLKQMVDILSRFRSLLSPLMTPELARDNTRCYLIWRDSCGAGDQQRFLVEAMMTATVALVRNLSGKRLPWKFFFCHAEPRHVEQYWVHLSEDTHFNWQLNMMSLPLEFLREPWHQQASTAARVALREAEQQQEQLLFPISFLDAVHDYLQAHIREPLSLERVADALQISSSTLKRKFQRHDTSFQKQLDEVRKKVALWLYYGKGYSNEEVAAWLNFNDITNYRRSFRRWTGFSPSALKSQWQQQAGIMFPEK